jgi:hypothetical protein
VTVHQELDQRWRLLVPPDVAIVAARPRDAALARLRELPSGTLVALVGGRRLRGLARRGRVRASAEYLALPTLATPVAITHITPDAMRWTARTVLTVPSGVTRLHAPAWAAVRLVRALPTLLSRLPAGDRILVGIRS